MTTWSIVPPAETVWNFGDDDDDDYGVILLLLLEDI